MKTEFFLNRESIKVKSGDAICVLTGVFHRFVTEFNGGHVTVICPQNLGFYFWELSKLLAKGNVFFELESEVGKNMVKFS